MDNITKALGSLTLKSVVTTTTQIFETRNTAPNPTPSSSSTSTQIHETSSEFQSPRTSVHSEPSGTELTELKINVSALDEINWQNLPRHTSVTREQFVRACKTNTYYTNNYDGSVATINDTKFLRSISRYIYKKISVRQQRWMDDLEKRMVPSTVPSA